MNLSTISADSIDREAQDANRAYLERVAAGLRARALHVETALVVGTPAHAISDYIHAHAVDMIAMATHGHGGLSRLLLGSVADAVAHTSDVLVLLNRPLAPVCERNQHQLPSPRCCR